MWRFFLVTSFKPHTRRRRRPFTTLTVFLSLSLSPLLLPLTVEAQVKQKLHVGQAINQTVLLPASYCFKLRMDGQPIGPPHSIVPCFFPLSCRLHCSLPAVFVVAIETLSLERMHKSLWLCVSDCARLWQLLGTNNIKLDAPTYDPVK